MHYMFIPLILSLPHRPFMNCHPVLFLQMCLYFQSKLGSLFMNCFPVQFQLTSWVLNCPLVQFQSMSRILDYLSVQSLSTTQVSNCIPVQLLSMSQILNYIPVQFQSHWLLQHTGCFSISLLVSSLLYPPSYDPETDRAQPYWRTSQFSNCTGRSRGSRREEASWGVMSEDTQVYPMRKLFIA